MSFEQRRYLLFSLCILVVIEPKPVRQKIMDQNDFVYSFNMEKLSKCDLTFYGVVQLRNYKL